MNPITEDVLMHYGVKRRSGRYPWGSGDSPYQHSGDFLSRVQELKKQGLSEKEIVKVLELDSTTQLRVAYDVAKHERRRLEVDRAKSLAADNLSPTEIGRIMGKNESSIRSLLNEGSEARMNRAQATADILRKELATKGMIDVGAAAEIELGVSRKSFEEALYMLEAEGYNVYGVGVPQVTNSRQQTNMKVLCNPDVEYKDAYQNMGEIQSLGNYHSTDGGATFDRLEYPSSIKSDRVKIRYAEEGGVDKDGVIELRRGVDDLDLGNAHYAQVRILVDGTHYLKGMAMYSDDMPDGADIVFNTNKKLGTDKMKVLKEITKDPDNPFGAYIKANGQSYYIDADGNRQLSAINKLKEEGDWDTMSRNLSSQFLSKQPMKLIKKQLDLTYADAEAEYDEIMSLTNPTIKRQKLLEFADECDSATVHLKAAALPRQETRVILPLTKLKETEVYAPYLNDGEEVVLIRYPHGGTFEIPRLTVNNKNKSAKSILGNVTDAIGINSKVAEQLSGADFDGDTVVVIPVNSKVQVKTSKRLDGLKDFDPKTQYSTEGKKGVKLLTKAQTQKEMGIVSNLITDMTLKGADEKEILRAVKHSMVVIDAAKHKLDYKQSEKDNGIAELKTKYQPKYDKDGNIVGGGGASTLISKKKQTVEVPERKGSGTIDPKTGKVRYKTSGRTYEEKKKKVDPDTGEVTYTKTGKVKKATTTVKLLNEVDDVRTLSSGTPQENAYADYANKMKALANTARIESTKTGKLAYSSSAAKTYKAEVDSLDAKVKVAAANAPKERRAQVIANTTVKAKVQSNPGLNNDKKELGKIKKAALDDARASVGASGKNSRIKITDSEWDAIQAGAISDTKLQTILRFADKEEVTKRAMPRTTSSISQAKINKITHMQESGYTIAEIAESINVPTSVVSSVLRDDEKR